MTRTSKYELSGESIAEFTGGRLVSGAGLYATGGASIDTRTIRPGQVFFALDGERSRGVRFVETAQEKSAAGIVVSDADLQDPAVVRVIESGRVFVVAVPDTTDALIAAARNWADILSPKVVAITGSVGKTTVKNLTSAAIGAARPTHWTTGNHNNRLGVSLTCLGLRPSHEVLVAEMGMNAPGEIAELCTIVKPDVGLVTTVAPVHLEGLGSIDNVAAAKSELIRSLGPGATAILNADDHLVAGMMTIAEENGARVVWFGSCEAADVRLLDAQADHDGRVVARISVFGRECRVNLRLVGIHNAMNAAAALAAAAVCGVDPEEACRAMAAVEPGKHRMELTDIGTIRLVDDCYNSSPKSVEAALEALASIAGPRRRVAVLGDMVEMGEHTDAIHREMGRVAAEHQVNCLIAVGRNASTIAGAAVVGGIPRSEVFEAPDSLDAASLARELLKPRDVVLVKASRGVGLELVVDALKARFGQGNTEAGN